MTEMQALKEKKKAGKATPADLDRLKVLQDGEPLSAADLEASRKREAERAAQDKADFNAKKGKAAASKGKAAASPPTTATGEFDIPADHPRIAEIKKALLPFTQIDAHASRQDEFVLFTRGISITAGDVRRACEAMKL